MSIIPENRAKIHERVRRQHSSELAQDYVEAIYVIEERGALVRVSALQEVFGVSHLRSSYGITEKNAFPVTCEHGFYHFLPWETVILLDRDTGKPLPRSGEQTGRASFFDMTHDGTWGGIITGDRITVDWDTPCTCGRTTPYIKGKVERYSEVEGGDDKITCAATPQAQADALDLLTSLEL